MQYDQSWMALGFAGALEAGLVSVLAGFVLLLVFDRIGRAHGWGWGPKIGWSYLLAAVLTASGDLWNLVYFNYARVQSLQLLKVKLAAVHDPDHIGLRAVFELLGIMLGLYLAWALASGDWRRRFGGH